MKIHPARAETGTSLIVVISVLATLMVVVTVAFEYTHVVNRLVQRSNTLESAVAVGDGCIDLLYGNWRKICRQNGTTVGGPPTSSFSSIPLPTAVPSPFPNIAGLTATTTDYYSTGAKPPSVPNISNYKVVALNSDWTPMPTTSAAPSPAIGQSRGSAMDTTDAAFSYLASADVTMPSSTGNLVAKVRRILQKKQESPWNWAIFYVDPLEIHPGPDFTVTGWVHTNGDLYTGHSTLHFADKVTYGSDWKISFMPGDGDHPGETPASPSYPDDVPPARDVEHEPFGADVDTFNFSTTDTNPNNDGYHELIEPPNPSYSDPLSAQRYYNQADVIVQVDATSSADPKVFIPKNDGSGGATAVTSGPLFNVIKGAVSSGTSIKDNREAKNVYLATLDIKALENNSGGNSPTWKGTGGVLNGLIYIYDPNASSGSPRAIKLINGDVIPATGLTVVSANPVYIQGDYNVGIGTPPSNNATSDPTKPTVAGYTRRPCSVIADAVNILSNAWNDANSTTALSANKRDATNTTINTAIVSGIVPTNAYGDGAYSGGAENFPRFLEDWTNVKLTYYGSMVQIYKSKQAIGEWGKDNVYGAPTRQWYFDTNFNVSAPPGTLMIVSYIKGRWYLAQ